MKSGGLHQPLHWEMATFFFSVEEYLILKENGLLVSSLGYKTCKGQVSANETVRLHFVIREILTWVFFFEKGETAYFCVAWLAWLLYSPG